MPELAPPRIDYTKKDYQSLVAELLYVAHERLPQWTDRSPNDVGVVLTELFAYMGDMVLYYTDRALNEGWTLPGTGTTPWEGRAAELLVQCVPSLEKVQITLSGSESTYHALRLFAEGQDALREVTEAKLLSQRSAFEVAETALRILNGDEEIGRVMRDTRLGPIGGGTDEVMKEILAKQLGP